MNGYTNERDFVTPGDPGWHELDDARCHGYEAHVHERARPLIVFARRRRPPVSNFTQPVCRPCWDFAYALRNEVREPVRVKDHEVVTCCNCAHPTSDGIFFRIDPFKVRYPMLATWTEGGPPPPPDPGPLTAPVPPRDRAVE